MAVPAGGVEPVRARRVVLGSRVGGERVVSGFLAQLPPRDPSVLHRAHEVVSSATEVLTDRFPVIGDRREFQVAAPFVLLWLRPLPIA
jgi:hypothetical protein